MDQAIDVTALVGTYGLAVALIIIGVLFGMFVMWPWYTKRAEKKDALEVERHSQYMKTIDNFTTAMNAVNITMSSTAQLIAGMTDKIDDHHRDVMSELRAKRKGDRVSGVMGCPG